jgi:hypothetical protein
MQYLNFRQEVNFEEGVYSVCLRGARAYDKKQPLLIFTGNKGALIDTPLTTQHSYKAEVVSYNQFRFEDLKTSDCLDNYDKDARTIIGLMSAMLNVYDDFDSREIVTILKFAVL